MIVGHVSRADGQFTIAQARHVLNLLAAEAEWVSGRRLLSDMMCVSCGRYLAQALAPILSGVGEYCWPTAHTGWPIRHAYDDIDA